MNLGHEERSFLDALYRHEQRHPINEAATNKRLPPATRRQDKARQNCRKLGLARFVTKRDGYTVSGWELTPMGRAEIMAVRAEMVPHVKEASDG